MNSSVGNPNTKRSSGGGSVIDFTTPGQNTYLRGRTNNLVNTAPTGIFGNGHFEPQANVVNN